MKSATYWTMAAALSFGLMGCEQKKTPSAPPTTSAPATTQAAAPTTTATTPQPKTPEEIMEASRKYGHVPIVGGTTRAEIVQKFQTWQKAESEAKAKEGVGAALAEVPAGAKVTVVFGSWCKDCFQQLPQLWDAFDQTEKEMPFEMVYIGLDETLRGDRDLSAMNIHNIPTLIVERDGKEVGRIIESSPVSIEEDFLALLSGQKKGIISGNPQVRTRYGLDEKK